VKQLAFIVFVSVYCILWPSESQLQDSRTDSLTAQESKHAGSLRIPFQDAVATIDPGLAVDQHSIEVVEQLFVGLTDFCPKTYQVVPELATHWEPDENGLVYTFHLREDAKWSNGEPITAHDVVWAVQRNLEPALNAPTVNNLYVLKNAESISQQKKPS
jgi:ABC-type oligopeptide transport system substrate-binding subunit